MSTKISLERFINAQEKSYPIALAEIKNGRKQSHWIWYIFPQVDGLGFSSTSKFYAIKDLNEAEAFLQHPVLGANFIEICEALLSIKNDNVRSVFGSPDDLKLKSSMTLFSLINNANPIFNKVLDKFFNGEKDNATLQILKHS
jgi:uncharacterized protein (DUF1810 family)